jgi:hypothetical protein
MVEQLTLIHDRSTSGSYLENHLRRKLPFYFVGLPLHVIGGRPGSPAAVGKP